MHCHHRVRQLPLTPAFLGKGVCHEIVPIPGMPPQMLCKLGRLVCFNLKTKVALFRLHITYTRIYMLHVLIYLHLYSNNNNYYIVVEKTVKVAPSKKRMNFVTFRCRKQDTLSYSIENQRTNPYSFWKS